MEQIDEKILKQQEFFQGNKCEMPGKNFSFKKTVKQLADLPRSYQNLILKNVFQSAQIIIRYCSPAGTTLFIKPDPFCIHHPPTWYIPTG